MATIERTRLLEAFGRPHPFTLIHAPAGFGKSTLLDQIERQLAGGERPVSRFDLADDTVDDDLAPALVRALASAGEAGEGGGAILLIDNADHLAGCPAARKVLERRGRGSGMPAIVLACRGDAGLALARHRASGDLAEIGPAELLFDAAEQREFVKRWLDRRILPAEAEAMAAAMGGWPCGFGLQERSLASGSRSQSARALHGRWRIVGDYFEQEVCAGLPGDVLKFLIEASVLEHLVADDCDAVFGGQAGERLELAHASGAPLWPIDPEHRIYAMLPLFRQFLRARIDSAQAGRIGASACAVLEAKGRFREACEQALGIGDHACAARLLECQFRADFAFREDGSLIALAERIDPAVRGDHPFILLALAQAQTFRFDFVQARHSLDRARALVGAGDQGVADTAGPEEKRSLEMLVLHREMVLALGRHELSTAQELGDRLLGTMEDVPPMQRVMILNSLTYAQQELYIFRGAERYYAQAKQLIPQLDSWISSIPLETFYARHLFQTGRTGAAMELLEQTLARLVDELGPRPVLGAIAGIALAEMKFEANDLAEAEHLLGDYAGEIEQFGFLPTTLSGRIMQARLHMARGEHDQGLAVLERPLLAAGELFDRMARSLTVERIYWLLRLGRSEAARIACNAIGLSLTRPPEPHSSAAAAEEAYATSWIQLARSKKKFEDAIHVAHRWQRYTEGVGAVRSNVRWNVILAGLQTLAEEPGLAMRHLRRAIQLGAAGQYRGSFLAEADLIHDQLAMLVDSDLSETERHFVNSIIRRKGAGADAEAGRADPFEFPVPLGTFSSREGAILRLVAKGMLNREIGRSLGMTEGTVKWYLHRIYDKLGIRRRSQVAMLVTQWQTRAQGGGLAGLPTEH